MVKSWFSILICFISIAVQAQDSSAVLPTDTSLKDSVIKIDTAAKRRDSIAWVRVQEIAAKKDSQLAKWNSLPYISNPFYKFNSPIFVTEEKRKWNGKEGLFYAALGLIVFFAIVKNNFSKYLQDLFRLFFRSTLKQRQIKEQLMEAPLPSLLFNLIFIISGALFLNLLFQHFKLGNEYNFWLLLLYTTGGLAAVYFVKFVSLKLCGWLFRLSEATDAYTFIVFTTNKILGIALLPFIVLLAFADGLLYQIAFSLSIIVIAIMFLYRFFLSYGAIHKGVRIDFFHFLLYLLAFEIAPLLLINKALLDFLR
ncbi:MAG TPA: DUF4271 domain-containing protein [Chitinophagaceae bacterium]|nr:DUF4271 domain-containing protein [Chitinophagaceae bacterium]